MGSASFSNAKNAKAGGASDCRRYEAALRTNFSVMQTWRGFWGRFKYRTELEKATRASDRMIQYWLSNRYSISAGDLADLIRTDAGFAILDTIMGDDAKPVWWKDFRRSVKRAELRRQQKALLQAIEENEQSELDV